MKMRLTRSQSVPLTLFGLALLSYGVFIPWMGLVGDDWPYMWVHHVMGPGGYASFVAGDRPFSAWVYVLFTPLLGEMAWPYHLTLFVERWLSAVLLWWVLRMVWPQHERKLAWVACLFLVYPGFKQQFIPLEFILHFTVLDLFLLSLGWMILAVRSPGRYWPYTLLSMAAACGMFSIEYFVGLEALRPILLWVVLGAQAAATWPQRVLKVLRYWLPNLAVLIAFAVWRVFIFKFPSYQPTLMNNLKKDPLDTLFSLALRIVSDLREVALGAWRQTLRLPEGGAQALLIFLVLVAAAALLVWLYFSRWKEADAQDDNWVLTPLLLGLFSLFVAGWPFWFPEIPVELNFPWDRPTLAFMLGVSFLFVGLIQMLQPRFQVYALALVVALAVGGHYQNAMLYRAEWLKLQDYFWQLSWRAPGLQAGTSILGEQIPLNYHSDSSLTPPLNWTYGPDQHVQQFRYKLFDMDARMVKGSKVIELQEGQPLEHTYRGYSFSGNTSNILMVYDNPENCLRVLSAADKLLPDLPRRMSENLALSHLDQIQVDAQPAARPPRILGPEPKHEWCYYFEKADLAGQQGDWQQVARLGDEAFAAAYFPNDRSELLPFVQGYARSGNWQEAERLSAEVGANSALKPALCSLWAVLQKAQGWKPEEINTIQGIKTKLDCSS